MLDVEAHMHSLQKSFYHEPPYAGEAVILLHMFGKFMILKLKSRLS